jgi:hypothetical protein
MHHWSDWRAGLKELRRVARARIVLLTFAAPTPPPFWLVDHYFPEINAIDRATMPPIDEIAAELGAVEIAPLTVPHDCVDGFLGAYWRRPEAYLDPITRRSISCFARFNAEPGLQRLRADIESGRWREINAPLLTLDALDVGYRLVVADL